MRKLKRMLREAQSAAAESEATGQPVLEVAQQRKARQRIMVARSQEFLQAYNEAAKRTREGGSPEDRVAKEHARANLRRAIAGRPPLTRRSFLRVAGLAAAATAAIRPRRLYASQPSVAIVGAGLAGIRCAHKLWTERGISSTLYDAQNPGGRCETNRGYFDGGQIAEMHGEFISSEHASVFALGDRYGYGIEDFWAVPIKTDDTYYYNGHIYSQDQLTADWKAFGYDTFHQAALQVPSPQTWNDHSALAAQWDNMDVPTWLAANLPGGLGSDFAHMCLESTIGNFGGDPSDTSALMTIWMFAYCTSNGSNNGYQSNSYCYVDGTDERWHFAGGNDQMVRDMIGELPQGTVQPGNALVAVKSNSNGTTTLTFKKQGGGSTFSKTYDKVVLAIPFKTLRNVDLSKASLSSLKRTAINQLGMGTNGKVIFQMNGHPWFNLGYDGNCLADSPTNWLWEMNYQVDNNNNPLSLLCHFPGGVTTPGYVQRYGVSQHQGVPPANMVNDILTQQIEKIFPGCVAAFRGKAWYHFGLNDPWVQGGYSYWRVGQVTGFAGYEPVPEGNIHFAGEHTSYDFPGYMEGALETGERAADEI